MSKFQIKFDMKKIEKELNKQVNEIVKSKQRELVIMKNKEVSNMNVLSQNAETMLRIFLKEYEKTHNYAINGSTDQFPDYVRQSLKKILDELEICGYILRSFLSIGGGWSVVLTPESIEYFEKKGSRAELFEELVESEKKLLDELIKIENEDGNMTEYVQGRLSDDPKDVFRGVLGKLYSNGLVSIIWADDIAYDVCLTQAGRTFFEREKSYNEKTKAVANTYNIGNIQANQSNLVLGDVVSSTLNIDNTISQIERKINEECKTEDERKELKALLSETQEIIESIKESRHIEKRKSFMERMSAHLEKHGWFYGAIIGLLGQAMLTMLSGQ